jgi:hypothetical protein
MRVRRFAFWSAALIAVGSACADNAGSGFHPGPSTTTSGGGVAAGGSGGTTGDSTGTTGGAGGSTVGTGAGGNMSSGTGTGAGGAPGGAGGGAGVGGDSGGAGAGGAAGGGGGGTGGGQMAGFSRPQGKLPNSPLPASMVNLPRADWQKGLVSPTIQDHKHLDYSGVLNGYLALNGNEEFWFYDISDPKTPKMLSSYNTPNRCATCGQKGEGEAESQNAPTFTRFGNKYYTATVAGVGVTIWDVTDQKAPKFVKTVTLEGISYGDFTAAVWGIYWQGDTIYVGGTNTGLHILDAHDPNNVTFVKRLPTSAFGGISAGPLTAIGNILVIMTPKENAGIATLDISDPVNPVALAAVKPPPNSYIAQFHRHYVFLQTPLRVWDVLTDPTTISMNPISSLTTEKSEYIAFGDDFLFLGHLRPDPGASKIDISNPAQMKIVERIWGRLDRTGNDDQFPLPIGNLLVLGDDQSPYYGVMIAAHATDPDKKPPIVDTVIPRNGSMGQSVKSRIGITFSDNIELATVDAASFIVRPMGGQPLAGKWSLAWDVVNFDPDTDLAPHTTYEIVLPKGGLTDLVENALAADFKATFTTQ